MSEELIIRHCSPTLAGLKTGNLFSCSYESKEILNNELRKLNRKLSSKGLRVLPLRISDQKALIYLYRPARLREDLMAEKAVTLLKDRGYSWEYPNRCIVSLISRLHSTTDFPHEIGLFLGYPPEDVQGFIENGAQESKVSGCWKVYGDEESAKKTFEKYKKCTHEYTERLINGNTLEQLAVAI
ncbi:MAG: DUF3793 family protein [Ruminococcaceae bacterium]|nr:DUF3793 family protein [Oscillospiraceae bacterium]